MKRIYLASPYSAPDRDDRKRNVDRAMRVGLDLLDAGYQPFVPILSHYWDEFASYFCNREVSYERWMEWALTWVAQCEAVLVLGISPGVEREIEFAHEHKIPVYYSVQELPKPR